MPAARYSHPRAGYRSAQNLLFLPSFSEAPCALRGADGRTAGGSADDCFLLFVTRACGAERGHSSSAWWPRSFFCSVVFRFGWYGKSRSFSHFSPREKKCAVRSAPGVETGCGLYFIHAGGLSWRVSSRMQLCGCSSQMVGGNFWARIQKFGGLGDGWDGASSCVSPRMLLKVFPALRARAVRTWVHYFRVPVSGSHCSGRLGVAYECENWNFRKMTFFVGAILGSTVDTCSSSVLWLLCKNFTHFLRCGGLGS